MFLGIDLGTSGVKTVLIDESGTCVAATSAPLPVSRPRPLWSEQNPEDWLAATFQTLDTIAQQTPNALSQVRGIGFTGQMHGATLLDHQGKVLRPAILWNDGRAYKECLALNAQDSLIAATANLYMPGFTAPKLLWLKHHEPEIFPKVAKVLLPKDYLRYYFTGDYATDVSDASGTLWLNVAQRCWSELLLSATDLTPDHMPRLHEGPEITGELRTLLCKRYRMEGPVHVVAGGGDNAAGAISLGITESHQAMLSLGTSGVLFVPADHYQPNPKVALHHFCHCIPNKWHHMGVILSAASCLNWWGQICGQAPDKLLQITDKTNRHRPLFLPYLSGERTPHNDPFAQGLFFGLTHETQTSDMTLAILEGVAFAIADCQRVVQAVQNKAMTITLIGGGAKSVLWGEILATVLNQPIQLREDSEVGPAYGAAKLALVGNTTQKLSELKPPLVKKTCEPNQNSTSYYHDRLAIYRDLYHNNRELLQKYSGI